MNERKREFLNYTVADRIATVMMDRPPVNALRTTDLFDIIEVFDEIDERDDVTVTILTSSSEKVFCAGRDVKAASVEPVLTRSRAARQAFWAIYDCKAPVIAAINGAALGAGLAICCVCDILIASENAVFALPEIDVGALGGYKFVSRLLPEPKARKMLLTAERIDAREAYRLGMVDKVVSTRAELMDEAQKIARTIASKSPIAVRMAKKSMIQTESLNLKEGYRIEQMFTYDLMKTEDAKEAAAAFVEKRAPRFKGR